MVYTGSIGIGPLAAVGMIIGCITPRYIYLSSIEWQLWPKGDIDRLVDLMREMILCVIIYFLVFTPEWWFTKSIFNEFGQTYFFELENNSRIDYYTSKELHRRYGLILTLLISVLDNWMVSESSREIIDK
jgi:hypothetical protein